MDLSNYKLPELKKEEHNQKQMGDLIWRYFDKQHGNKIFPLFSKYDHSKIYQAFLRLEKTGKKDFSYFMGILNKLK